MDQSIEKLLEEREVAELLRVSPETLANWRKSGDVALPFLQLGPRLIRYRASDVRALVEAESSVQVAE